jgi:hypothetical protein
LKLILSSAPPRALDEEDVAFFKSLDALNKKNEGIQKENEDKELAAFRTAQHELPKRTMKSISFPPHELSKKSIPTPKFGVFCYYISLDLIVFLVAKQKRKKDSNDDSNNVSSKSIRYQSFHPSNFCLILFFCCSLVPYSTAHCRTEEDKIHPDIIALPALSPSCSANTSSDMILPTAMVVSSNVPTTLKALTSLVGEYASSNSDGSDNEGT